mgnify:CR=1 FL=1|jgi:uncharacterized C2H2 Zn-finger protein|tara:strand:- start:527 stop:763 length:237 start_codon:yes stop_codon:yes gene_type:complete
MTIIENKYGELFIAVPLNTLKSGEWFKLRHDSVREYSKAHYNKKNRDYPTATYTCMPDNDVWGSGVFINAKAIVYVTE